jgi:regulator of cell morphogenesis and NO signaling
LNDTVDTIVCQDLQAAIVLSKAGIDFCNDGRKSLEAACAGANISCSKILRQISRAESSRLSAISNLKATSIDELTRLLEYHHHVYISECIPFIQSNIARLTRIYGRRHPELEQINQTFLEMAAHLTVHMRHEELLLFPYIRKMVKRGERVKSGKYKSVRSPIIFMIEDHGTEHKCLKKLDDLTHHYSAPGEPCSIFQVTYHALEVFEKDLHAHMRLEKEVLFPNALQLESIFNMAPYNQN